MTEPPALFDQSTTIRTIAAALHRAGLESATITSAGLHLHIATGQRWRETAAPPLDQDPAPARLSLRATDFGRYRGAGPEGGAPLLAPGRPVEKDQLIGFLEVEEAVLIPLRALAGGQVTCVHVMEGDLIGFDTPLADLAPGIQGER